MNKQSFCTGCLGQVWDVLFLCCECQDVHLCLQCTVSGFETGKHKRNHQFVLNDLGTFYLFEQEELEQEMGSAMEVDELEENYKKNEIDLSDFLEDKSEFEKLVENQFGRSNFSPVEIIRTAKDEIDQKGDEVSPSGNSEKHNWRALEEMVMLDGISKNGFGNWPATASSINRTLHLQISPEEVKRHYYNHYINGIIGNLTLMWIHTDPFVIQMSNFPNGFSFNNGKLKIFENHENKYTDIAPELMPIGYTPTRDDFERDFDQEAEYLISNLLLSVGEDDEIERKFKMTQIDMYQRRLLHRFRKRTLVCENGFLRSFLEKSKHSKENLKNHHILIPFMRYLTKNEFEGLTRDLMKEHYLKLFLKKLVIQYYQSLGDGTDQTETSRNKRIKAENSEEVVTPEEKELYEKLLSNSDEFDKDILKYWFKVESINSIIKVTKQVTSEINSPNTEKFLQQTLDFFQKSSSGKSKKPSLKLISQEGFEASSLPGAHLLSEEEIKLCNELRLVPAVYLNYKTMLIKDQGNYRTSLTLDGILSLSKFKCSTTDELNAMKRIYYYLTSHGMLWDNSHTSADTCQPSTSQLE